MARRRVTPQPNGQPYAQPNVSPIPRPVPRLNTVALEAALQQTLYTGARVGQLLTADGVTPLVDLLAPPAHDDSNRGGRRASVAEEIIRTAIASVGGTYATVMEILLQLAPGTSGLPLSQRREQCAQLMGVSADTFMRRDNYEKQIMRILLMEIYRILIQRGIAT